MKIEFSRRAVRDYRRLAPTLQKTADKQFSFLLKDLRYPSLRAKKHNEARDVWQARVNDDFRFYFRIKGDIYQIITIVTHPK